MANLLQKISWNENLYQKPDISGYYIEQGNDNYIAHFGVGHEAWNFNKSDLVDGKVYGYLKAEVSTLFNEKHNIFFFSRNLNGDLFLVGYYKDCKYLAEEERIKLRERMAESGILDKRINQVYRILRDEDDFSEWSWDDVEEEFGFEVSSFKLEVLPENVIIFDKKIPFTEQDCIDVLEKGWQERYGNYTFIPDLEEFMSKIVEKELV
ncbi:hypothetical protein D9K79_17515 [Acinetobacter cumulans]|jgi:hypothetical protein|uniref:Uncharacterized protein n=2 Tax=Acinetobacter TaxID=469 RepID=A0ABX9U1A7_9GAMM|nr:MULTISPECIES: hypothetical protein [Acinetobacter]RLL17217.1 hypothetical protein D9K81_17390 [Acinetobacter chengduensis]RLL36933.1 hypothetical protein D9K79_17515 [Acinetobacter cumulans]